MKTTTATTATTARKPGLVRVSYRREDGEVCDFISHKRAEYASRISGTVEILAAEPFEALQYKDTAAVAALLPGGPWTVSPAWEDANTPHDLTRPDGLTLWVDLRGDRYGSRGKGSASYHRPRDGKGQNVDVYAPAGGSRLSDPSINFSLDKTPEQRAADIARRLLPEAEKMHALVLERISQADEYHAKEDTAAEAVKTMKSRCGVYFRADGSTIEVKGYTSPAVARKIADLLATLPDSRD